MSKRKSSRKKKTPEEKTPPEEKTETLEEVANPKLEKKETLPKKNPSKKKKKSGKKSEAKIEEELEQTKSEEKGIEENDIEVVDEENGKPSESDKSKTAIEEDDEYAITLLGWATSGYDTSKLESSLSKGDMKQFKKDYKKFEKGVVRIESMKNELERLNIAGVESEVDKLLELLKNPLHTKRAENELDFLKKLIHAKDLEVELDSMMSVDALKDRALALKEDLKDPANIDDVTEEMKDLRREFKEEYALSQFMELIDEKPRDVKKIKVREEVRKTKNPMVVKDLFVFTSTGRFLGNKTARKDVESSKQDIISKLNKAKDIISKDNITPGMSLKIPAGDETLLVHKGEHVAVGLIISGVPHKLAGKLLKKGVNLMETEDADAISLWKKTNKPKLPHIKKNMKALIYAAIKLGAEMKK